MPAHMRWTGSSTRQYDNEHTVQCHVLFVQSQLCKLLLSLQGHLRFAMKYFTVHNYCTEVINADFGYSKNGKCLRPGHCGFLFKDDAWRPWRRRHINIKWGRLLPYTLPGAMDAMRYPHYVCMCQDQDYIERGILSKSDWTNGPHKRVVSCDWASSFPFLSGIIRSVDCGPKPNGLNSKEHQPSWGISRRAGMETV